jgi:hypothetical protein
VIKPTLSHRSFVISALVFIFAGCAAPTQTVKTLDDPAYRGKAFSKFLVVGVTASYDNRAQFERQMVAAIKSAGGSATAYYTMAGDTPTITPQHLESALSAGNFDAVLLTRVARQQSEFDVVEGAAPGTKVVRESGNVFDLFRYDYEELNEPDTVEIETAMVVVTELYSAADRKKIWAIQSSSKSTDSAGLVIDRQVDLIMRQLQKDKLIGS